MLTASSVQHPHPLIYLAFNRTQQENSVANNSLDSH